LLPHLSGQGRGDGDDRNSRENNRTDRIPHAENLPVEKVVKR
jgi:hypothetical protein